MSVLSLTLIKQHLNIPSDYTGDDTLLEAERDAAEAYAAKFFDIEEDDYDSTEDYQAAVQAALSKTQVQQALLMFIATLYNSRESEVYTGTQETKAFDRLLYQFKNWGV